MFVRSICSSTICLLWLILSLIPASAARYKVRIGQVSDLPSRIITLSCPDEGYCFGDLKIVYPDTDHFIPVSVRIIFEPGTAYFRFRMTHINIAANEQPLNLAVNEQSVLRMPIRAGRGSAEVGLAFPTKGFADETAHPGMVVPVFVAPFTTVEIDIRPENN